MISALGHIPVATSIRRHHRFLGHKRITTIEPSLLAAQVAGAVAAAFLLRAVVRRKSGALPLSVPCPHTRLHRSLRSYPRSSHQFFLVLTVSPPPSTTATPPALRRLLHRPNLLARHLVAGPFTAPPSTLPAPSARSRRKPLANQGVYWVGRSSAASSRLLYDSFSTQTVNGSLGGFLSRAASHVARSKITRHL